VTGARFHTLALVGKQQARAISLKGLHPIGVPCGREMRKILDRIEGGETVDLHD
jgi:hypothetical protein